MYQVVLAAALATSGGLPNHCYARVHCGGCGCYSGYYGYSGYSGYSGYAGHYCHGCSIAPVYTYGCAGACYGYHGGCYGGWGVFTGEAYHIGCTGCYGCYGGYACYGVPVPIVHPAPGGVRPPVGDPFPPVKPDTKKKDEGGEEVNPPKEKPKQKSDSKKLEEQQARIRARVVIDIPEGAKLFVDGQPINVQAGTRTFQTPELEPDQAYFYDLRIERNYRGEVIRDQRRVVIRPGQEVAVTFPQLTAPNTLAAQRER